jgi:AmmeMemoRadiSam system protein B
VPLAGLAASSSDAFATPLGEVATDPTAIAALENLPQVAIGDEAHAHEHSLEVQLPFLQILLPAAQIVPLVVGDASPAEIAACLDCLWGDNETRIVVSSDLSHYLDYASAQRADRATADKIEQLNYQDLESDAACGCAPVRGLLMAARQHQLKAYTVDLRNSGDTAGSRGRVVGYGAFTFAGAVPD